MTFFFDACDVCVSETRIVLPLSIVLISRVAIINSVKYLYK